MCRQEYSHIPYILVVTKDTDPYLLSGLEFLAVEAVEQEGQEEVEYHEVSHDQGR